MEGRFGELMFELTAVRKDYGGKPILGPLSVDLRRGESTVLLGPSGCGKSTLLRLCLGLIVPDAGTVAVAGSQPTDAKQWMMLRRRIGTVVQDGGLFPHLSARRNVGLLAEHLGWDDGKIDRRIRDLADLVRLPADALARFPDQLSGGQKQRIALMRALMLEPEPLLLDEPLGALDPIVRSELQTDLRRIIRELKTTVVLVTHDLGEAVYFADRILLLKDGGILQDGTAADLFQRPADPFVTKFVQAQRPPDAAVGQA